MFLKTARRVILATVAGAAGLAVLAGPIAAADAAGPCTNASCISNVSVQAGGLDASIVFDTAVKTTDWFFLSYNNTVVAQVGDGVPTLHHQLTSPATLQPNTTYTWLLQATTRNGRSVTEAGTVTTLHRQVDVLFSTLTVNNDSDADSAGEFRTWVRSGNDSHIDNQVPESISDGQTVLATDLIRTRDVGTSTPVYTEMMDNDSFNPVFPTLQLPFPNTASWTSGTAPFWDWSTAAITLPTTYATNGLVPFQTSVNHNVAFVLKGYYSVTFVS